VVALTGNVGHSFLSSGPEVQGAFSRIQEDLAKQTKQTGGNAVIGLRVTYADNQLLVLSTAVKLG
jgi:uncharacterized protein YbjQ (UPF0145 family)